MAPPLSPANSASSSASLDLADGRFHDQRLTRRHVVMAILFRSTPAATARWRPLLARLLPDHEIRYWPKIGDRAAIEYALVWQPEPGLLASLPNLKLIVGLGAGVDHVLGDPLLPKGVPIVRLVDPYMTDAMSE